MNVKTKESMKNYEKIFRTTHSCEKECTYWMTIVRKTFH